MKIWIRKGYSYDLEMELVFLRLSIFCFKNIAEMKKGEKEKEHKKKGDMRYLHYFFLPFLTAYLLHISCFGGAIFVLKM